MIIRNQTSLQTYHFETLSAEPRLLHFVTTRHGGVSKPPFDEINFAFHVGDRPEDVLANRRLVLEKMGVPLEWLVTAEQVHGDKVTVVTKAMRGQGALSPQTALPATDALVTNEPGVCLAIMTADCVPVILYDPRKQVVAVAHAGWRGTVSQIVAKTVRTMVEGFGSRPTDILAAIGPSIGPEDYEVGEDVAAPARSAFPGIPMLTDVGNGKYLFDLWAANLQQLLAAGLSHQNVALAGLSTYQQTATFFSARRAQPTGRFATAVMLRGPLQKYKPHRRHAEQDSAGRAPGQTFL